MSKLTQLIPKRVRWRIKHSRPFLSWVDGRYRFLCTADVAPRVMRGGIEQSVCRWITSHLKPGDTAVEVGVNYGWVAMELATAVGPQGRVIGYELEPLFAGIARRNFAANGFRNIELHVGACGSVHRVDDLNLAPQAVLIDVDGAEDPVLDCMTETLRKHRPALVIEPNNGNGRHLIERLRGFGYTRFFDQRNNQVNGTIPPNICALAS